MPHPQMQWQGQQPPVQGFQPQTPAAQFGIRQPTHGGDETQPGTRGGLGAAGAPTAAAPAGARSLAGDDGDGRGGTGATKATKAVGGKDGDGEKAATEIETLQKDANPSTALAGNGESADSEVANPKPASDPAAEQTTGQTRG